MNGLTPNCLDDFLFSTPTDKRNLEFILSRKLPFPFGGKTGILLHGTWGTGKSTLALLLPELIEAAYNATLLNSQTVGQITAPTPSHAQTKVFRCGGGLSSVEIVKKINDFNNFLPISHKTQHDYFVFDEVDRLTSTAQQSLRSTLDLKRCMFFFTTNYLSKVDPGIVNRCHLIEMNQMKSPLAYVPLGQSILQRMSVREGTVPDATLESMATKARGSLRDYTHAVIMEGLTEGGVMP
jgi:DNA polymerase III delta prime subunit